MGDNKNDNRFPYATLEAITIPMDGSPEVVWDGKKRIDPLRHMLDVWNKVREGVGTFDGTPEDFFLMIINEHAEPPEFLQMSWLLHNVSRAFCAQLQRGRLASYWERSLRAYDCSGFSERKEYQPLPDDMNYEVVNSREESFSNMFLDCKQIYDNAMKVCDDSYKALLSFGVPVEMARGVLPLHIYTKVWWRVDLRNFYQKIKSRTCFLAQREYWHPLIMSMKDELVKINPVFQELFRPPCKDKEEGWVNCIMPNDCIGRIENRIKLDPCPLFEKTPDYKEYTEKKRKG